MNINRMHLEFKLALDKMDSNALPDLKVAEIDYWLNEGMMNYIKTRYSRLNLYGQGFEEIQKRTDDLKALVITKYSPVTVVAGEENVYQLDIQNLTNDENGTDPYDGDYFLYLRGRVKNVTDCGDKYVGLKLKRHDELDRILDDPFNVPDKLNPVGYFENNQLYVVTDGKYTVNAAKITFLKYPFYIDKAQILNPVGLPGTATIELDEHTHKEIIKYSVEAALENIESPRQATYMTQMKLSE